MKKPVSKPFSVLLIYPDHISDGPEAYYGFVRAGSPAEATSKAQLQAARAVRRGEHMDRDDLRELADDFKVELVLRGHRRGLAWEELNAK
jgi:hypothetical protein